jgi:hypothetical protein
VRPRHLVAIAGWLGGATSCASVLGWDLDGYGSRATTTAPHGASSGGDGGARGGAGGGVASTSAGGHGGAGGATLSTGCAAPCGEGASCDPVFGWCVTDWARWPMPSWKGSGEPNEPSYTVKDGVVRDGVTGLEWQEQLDPQPCNGAPACRFYDAHLYCRTLALGGGGWRLPSLVELVSILDYGAVNAEGQTIDLAIFPATPPQKFWTSSCGEGPCLVASPGDLVGAWYVDMHGGTTGVVGSAATCRVRCVR